MEPSSPFSLLLWGGRRADGTTDDGRWLLNPSSLAILPEGYKVKFSNYGFPEGFVPCRVQKIVQCGT